MSKEELKPCPFCGGTIDVNYEPSKDCLSILCMSCGVEMESTELGEIASLLFQRWNGRYDKLIASEVNKEII